MSDYITCVRCSKRHPRTSRKGRPPIRCPECARAAELERWRRANRKRNARLRRQAAFGPETPEVAAKVDELAAKVATLSAAGLRDFFYHAANRSVPRGRLRPEPRHPGRVPSALVRARQGTRFARLFSGTTWRPPTPKPPSPGPRPTVRPVVCGACRWAGQADWRRSGSSRRGDGSPGRRPVARRRRLPGAWSWSWCSSTWGLCGGASESPGT